MFSVDECWLGRWLGPTALAVDGDGIRLATDADPAPSGHLAGTVLPGFTDAHVHLGLIDGAALLAGGIAAVDDLGWDPDIARQLACRPGAADRPLRRRLPHRAGRLPRPAAAGRRRARCSRSARPRRPRPRSTRNSPPAPASSNSPSTRRPARCSTTPRSPPSSPTRTPQAPPSSRTPRAPARPNAPSPPASTGSPTRRGPNGWTTTCSRHGRRPSSGSAPSTSTAGATTARTSPPRSDNLRRFHALGGTVRLRHRPRQRRPAGRHQRARTARAARRRPRRRRPRAQHRRRRHRRVRPPHQLHPRGAVGGCPRLAGPGIRRSVRRRHSHTSDDHKERPR